MNESTSTLQSVEEFLAQGGNVEVLESEAKPQWAKQCTGGSYSVANKGRKAETLKAKNAKS